jgi:hypothetical protein
MTDHSSLMADSTGVRHRVFWYRGGSVVDIPVRHMARLAPAAWTVLQPVEVCKHFLESTGELTHLMGRS